MRRHLLVLSRLVLHIVGVTLDAGQRGRDEAQSDVRGIIWGIWAFHDV